MHRPPLGREELLRVDGIRFRDGGAMEGARWHPFLHQHRLVVAPGDLIGLLLAGLAHLCHRP